MTARSPVLRAEKQLHTVRCTLSKREQRYVEARAQGMPPVPSARVAGFEDDSVTRELERDVRICTTLETMREVQGLKQQLICEDVLAGLYEATEMVPPWRDIGRPRLLVLCPAPGARLQCRVISCGSGSAP